VQVIALRLASHESVARATRVSTLAGLVGLGLVVAPGLGTGSTALGLAIMISASISWSTGSFFSRRLGLPRDPFVATTYEMLAGGVFLTVGATAFGEWGDLGGDAFALDSVAAWAYLVVFGSLLGFTSYAWLLRVAPISLVVTHQYVNPIVAVALGVLLLGERPSPFALVGALLVVAAVYVAVRAETPRSRPATVAPQGTPADQTA
jgi:drug/metabolite transporter (DMT)-like permease